MTGRSGDNQANADSAGVEPVEILAGRNDFVPTGFDVRDAGSPRPDSLPSTEVDWQTAMKRAIRSTAELRRHLGLPQKRDSASTRRTKGKEVEGRPSFPTFVPWEFLRRIRSEDPTDPLLQQVLPTSEEQIERSGFSADPVGDLNALATGGLLHKYDGRALIVTTGACGVHCRYCFRREFPYSSAGSRSENWRPALDYVREHTNIEEVLLSGGDPLTIVDEKIDELVKAIEEIPHVRRLRIHSRMPIVIPQRVTSELVARLASSRLAVWMVVHANHPNELDAGVFHRLAMLIDNGIPVLNQSVLLRGVNDDAETLIELSRKLVDHRVQPYYLHQLDRVRGTAQFEVAVSTGMRLIDKMRESLPGYAVPTYVVEEAGSKSKTLVADDRVTAQPKSMP